MRPLPLTRLAVGLLLGLAGAWMVPPAAAQPPKPRKATFKTVDGVELEGSFYPSPKGRDAYCVLLLHAVGGNMQQEGWDALAQELQKEEFAVLAFDFRGHGGSKAVTPGQPATASQPAKPGFWDVPTNRQMATKRPVNPQQPPKTIDFHDFQPGYYPMLINDITAAKLFLDERNDAMECNSSRLIVVGAQEGAALGLTWMASECYRYKVTQRLPIGQPVRWSSDSEADSLACGLWLSASPSLGNRQLPTREWLELLGHKYEVPMGFLYGEQDTASANFASSCVKTLQAGRNKNPLTAERAIKDTKLAGVKLLNKDLGTAKTVVQYLSKVREDRKGAAWKSKKTSETGYVWTIRGGAPVEAKGDKDEVMNLVPLSQLLR